MAQIRVPAVVLGSLALSLLCCFPLFPCPVSQGEMILQNRGPGSLRVVVANEQDGTPIEGVAVVIQSASGAQEVQARTGLGGVAEFFGLPSGDYTIGVRLPGVGWVPSRQVTVASGSQSERILVCHHPYNPGESRAGAESTVPVSELRRSPKARKEFDAGNADLTRGRYLKARLHYERAIALEPVFAEAFGNLAVALLHLGDRGGARGVLNKAIDLDPALRRPHVNLGLLLEAEGKWDEAAAAFGRAAKLRPADPEVLSYLFRVSLRQGSPALVLQVGQRIHAAGALEHQSVHILLARICRQLGLATEARRQYELYLEEDPGGPLKDEASSWHAVGGGKGASVGDRTPE